MIVMHCDNCNANRGFARRLGWGTFFAVALTGGLWLLALPFYPKRCTVCGCEEGFAGMKGDIRGGGSYSKAAVGGTPAGWAITLAIVGAVVVFVVFAVWQSR